MTDQKTLKPPAAAIKIPARRASIHPALLIAPVVWCGWVLLMASGDRWSLFQDNWFMTVTMCAGSFIAGATSEGGGAVAFPVMTLLFHIQPSVARDFSLLIQSVGMTAAGLTIVLLRIRVEWRAIVFSGLGGAVGVVLGLELISPLVAPPYVKMFFTSLWLSFGVTLFWLHRHPARQVEDSIVGFRAPHACLLLGTGVVGGTISGLTGSGLDITTFLLLTLLFRVCEKVATPTSVILMASNALVGALWAGAIRQSIAAEAWSYWYVCVPVVVVGAPLGAWFISQRSRHFIVGLLCVSIVVQFVASLIIVPQTVSLLVFSAATLVTGLVVFRGLAWAGLRRGRLVGSGKCA